MAVTNTPLATSLRPQVQIGTDDGGKPLYRIRSYSRVKPESIDEDIYEVASALGELQIHPVSAISRLDENDLSEDA